MERERVKWGNGAPDPERPQALGDVARDVMDHASAILRDRVRISALEARRYVEHVRRDVAPRAAFRAMTVALGALAVVFGLVALFLGIASALGSVAWTFAIYAGIFAVATIVAASLAARTPHRDEREEVAEMARRFSQTSPPGPDRGG